MSDWQPPQLWVLTDLQVAAEPVLGERLARLCEAAKPGSLLVQLRDKEVSARRRLELGLRLRALTAAAGHLLAVNDRLDLAWLLEADVVHLAEASVEPERVRVHFGKRFRISRACHRLEDCGRSDVDAVVVSPCFAARKGRAPLLQAGLAEACRRSQEGGGAAVIALGGVGVENALGALQAGAAGVAVIGAALSDAAWTATGGQPPPAMALLAALGLARR